MAEKKYKILREFKGVNRHISKRDAIDVLQTCENLDSNLEEGMLISRKGSTVKQSSGATPNIDKFVMFRDEAWAKDVLLVYDKDATAADRKIYVYTRTSETDNSFAPHSTASYAYGSLRFGDRLTFMVHRNGARIGTGTAATNKAMFAGYIDRTAGSEHDALFNDAIEFNDFFLLKQQWVMQESLIGNGTEMIYDSTREKWYILTRQGLEIRDSDFHIERILGDVMSHSRQISSIYYQMGGLALTGNSLYVIGRDTTDVGGDFDTKLILYDLSNDFEIDGSYTFDRDSSEIGLKVTTDGTLVYATWTDGTDSFIAEFPLTLGSRTNRYTSAGNTNLIGITNDGTYIYACDADTGDLVQMLIAAPYTSATFATGVTPLYIAHYSGNLYWTTGNIIYQTATATFNSKTAKYTDTDQKISGISFVSAVPYLAQDQRVVSFDNVTDFNETGYIPSKISLYTNSTSLSADFETWFYAISIVDIYGQESHLMKGFACTNDPGVTPTKLTLSVNVDSENFAEMTSPSTDPAEELSVWNEFRRIKKFRIYRAYNEGVATEPTTDYNFLREVDINDTSWTEVTANVLYQFRIEDTTAQADISTVTYEESSGLPETFKPYYTNWQYGINYQDRYYYGNVRTDELNAHEIIETPINSPDAAYQHDQNIDYFYPDDGDEIKGFAQVWSRMLVFKGNNMAIYNALSQEKTYDIGTSAPDSILVHNNIAYFIFGTGIYALNPSGYERISDPIDPLLASLTLTSVSGVKFKEKQKLWWLVPQGDSFCFNYNKISWDVYDIQSGTRDVVFIGPGLDDTIFTSDQYDDKIYKENTGTNDGGAGNPIQISMITNDIAMGDGYRNATTTRLFVTSKSTDNISLKTYWRNENGSSNVTKTFTATADLATTKKYVSSMWGQFIKFEITQNITAEVKIDSIGFEYFIQGELQDAS